MTSARILATLAVLSSSAVHAEPVPLPVSICDAHNSPKTRLARGGYAFCDPDGWLTENEFIRRYRDLTGARDLDRHHTVRSRARWITSAVLGGAGLGLLAYGLATLKHGCGPYDDHDPACIDNKRHILYGNTTWSAMSETLAALGGGMVVASTVVFFAGPGRDGSPLDHHLNRLAADLMVKRYDDARRATLPPAGEEDSKIEVQPYVSANGAGIVARF